MLPGESDEVLAKDRLACDFLQGGHRRQPSVPLDVIGITCIVSGRTLWAGPLHDVCSAAYLSLLTNASPVGDADA
jgi:hypothetical protein